MVFDFKPPTGWIRLPFPPPGRGIYLRTAPPRGKKDADPEAASILLFDAVMTEGTLEAQLAQFVERGCVGATPGKADKPATFKAAGGLSGALTSLKVKVTAGGKTREETRVFALVHAGDTRLPVAFIAAAKAPDAHRKAFDALLASVGPLPLDTSPYARWNE